MILVYFNNIVRIRKAIFLAAIFLSFVANAQVLEVTPQNMEFEDVFNRLENVYFVNTGNDILWIDSIVYNNDIYYVRFDRSYSMPFYLGSGDTVKMDCILAGYYYVSSSDTSDTMYVYSNSINGNSRESIPIKIGYYDNDFGEGMINGQVTNSTVPVADALIYFFYQGNYLIRSTQTNQSGFYSINLPPGWYTIAAEKEAYYVTFFGQKYDPFDADFVFLENDSTATANIELLPYDSTGNSISGIIYDSLSITPLRRGIVVARRGRHSPAKIVNRSVISTNGTYTTFVKEDGSYNINNIVEPGYYFVQSFSDYFVPSYYSSNKSVQAFWQNADSVFIGSALDSLNINMERDSSLGGGTASGSVNLKTEGIDSNTDVIIYAQSANNYSTIFNYSFSTQNGSFNVPFLPYGSYRLVAQKIGYYDGYSPVFTIDSQNTVISNLNISLMPNSAHEAYIPEDHVLLYNYPNPFNPSTTIEFFIPYSSHTELKIYNILGAEIRVLLSEDLSAGTHKADFNGSGLSSGIYLAVLKTNKEINITKVVLLK